MPDPNDDNDQSLAETSDEENITPDGRDIATSDLQREVYDMTSAAADADEAPEDDFDPDAADAAELEAADEHLDEPRSFERDDVDLIAADDARPADAEPEGIADDELETLGFRIDAAAADDPTDAALDEALKETFPASDPVSISRRPG